ncbi:unnamed protein product [Arctia plantaginis]|uniref:Uncharacterized protein n=1 Tax=Arctia plantaginis TaxID=874455 RepID=A0A8S1BLG0_ARCPL|nr:unnamed protein product [Arctia plantaginis]
MALYKDVTKLSGKNNWETWKFETSIVLKGLGLFDIVSGKSLEPKEDNSRYLQRHNQPAIDITSPIAKNGNEQEIHEELQESYENVKETPDEYHDAELAVIPRRSQRVKRNPRGLNLKNHV